MRGRDYIYLYYKEYLSLFDSLLKTVASIKAISESREELQGLIHLYTYLYQQLQEHYIQFEDQGYCIFESTLEIIRVVRVLLKEEKMNLEEREAETKRVLQPLMVEVIKFASMVVKTNEIFSKITS